MKFLGNTFFVMGKALTGELSCLVIGFVDGYLQTISGTKDRACL